jgi:arginase
MALGGDSTLLSEPLGLRTLAEERAVLVGARDLDPAEERYLAGSRVTRTTVDEVSPELLPDGPVLLHVDVDVIDPRELPGLRFPAADGPTRSRVLAAVERLLRSGRVAAFDVACPWLDTDDESHLRRRAEVVAAFLALHL